MSSSHKDNVISVVTGYCAAVGTTAIAPQIKLKRMRAFEILCKENENCTADSMPLTFLVDIPDACLETNTLHI